MLVAEVVVKSLAGRARRGKECEMRYDAREGILWPEFLVVGLNKKELHVDVTGGFCAIKRR
jgi:hypothetical protein